MTIMHNLLWWTAEQSSSEKEIITGPTAARAIPVPGRER
jgi:hypothetical protein